MKSPKLVALVEIPLSMDLRLGEVAVVLNKVDNRVREMVEGMGDMAEAIDQVVKVDVHLEWKE